MGVTKPVGSRTLCVNLQINGVPYYLDYQTPGVLKIREVGEHKETYLIMGETCSCLGYQDYGRCKHRAGLGLLQQRFNEALGHGRQRQGAGERPQEVGGAGDRQTFLAEQVRNGH